MQLVFLVKQMANLAFYFAFPPIFSILVFFATKQRTLSNRKKSENRLTHFQFPPTKNFLPIFLGDHNSTRGGLLVVE